MKTVIHTAQLRGIQPMPVRVEVSLSHGIPGISIVGMPDTNILEARSRIRCALRACGYEIPRVHITINLAPAEMKKMGAGLDLPIAVAILLATNQIPPMELDDCLFIGELGLDGSVSCVKGMLAYAQLAEKTNKVLVSNACVSDCMAECKTKLLTNLSNLKFGIPLLKDMPLEDVSDYSIHKHLDYKDVYGQELVKRAMVIAATGKHGIMMIGPPGSGKTMLARRISTILPKLPYEKLRESRLIYSVSGETSDYLDQGYAPFRAPHHSCSVAGLIGGGRPVGPGEISLAHNGVLFLDELPEFKNDALQSLRQPLEDREVRLIRADGTYLFPADFLLVCAANPCPCGYLGDSDKTCRCSATDIQKYQAKLTGPFADRIDLHVNVFRPDAKLVVEGSEGQSSQDMRQQVAQALEFKNARNNEIQVNQNGVLVERLYDFEREATLELERLGHRLHLGGRAIAKIAKIARTISDIACRDKVDVDSVIEAIGYRRN